MDAEAHSEFTVGRGDALLLTDLQIDFFPGGSLAVPGAERIVPVVQALIELFESHKATVLATACWHPPGHCSFREQGGPWPPHCLAGTRGAEFIPALRLPKDMVVVRKGVHKERDAYSGFSGTDLRARLEALGVRRLFVAGVATEYCVLNTVLDGCSAGFEVVVLQDAIGAIDPAQAGPAALAEMKKSKALLSGSDRLR